MGILALLELYAPFGICKLQILLAVRETDPVSGHHLESITYKMQPKPPDLTEAFLIPICFQFLISGTSDGRKKGGVAH